MEPNTMTAPVAADIDGAIGYLTLNDAERRNPLSVDTMLRMTGALHELSKSGVHVIVIRAAGTVFSAGHNLAEMIDRTRADEQYVFDVCTELMETVQTVPQPVIAEVAGHAIAAGCQLVASCDLAIASTSAVFGTPGVKIGLFCSTPGVAVVRAVGRKRAMQMLLTGETIDARTAADWGLINEAVDPADLEDAVRSLAAKITGASTSTLTIGKRAFYEQVDLPQSEAYRRMGSTMAINAQTCDAQEGMQAFLDKREPHWQGK
ncbi:enoyl-CoA hydratase/carnithine racemase [Spelaeicoccus albus]|uniref:Enoyl-CoA hydratase domain-containing protein 3, mitochondrial n=2 Tax=Spelaeicoccus albus TaxID=1280376 RepID=A0A7Z0AAF5_9MICO|nr:enoyl-CoA hydratase/carnithine racemase [Spelaeicoccus albus]